jgi:hypothetical protein
MFESGPGIGEEPLGSGAGILGAGGCVLTGFGVGAECGSFFMDEYGI